MTKNYNNVNHPFFWKSAITKYNNGIFDVLLSSITPNFADKVSLDIFSDACPDSEWEGKFLFDLYSNCAKLCIVTYRLLEFVPNNDNHSNLDIP